MALVLGAVAMGVSPVFVRLADVGPFTSAFWRLALAVPPLWLWMVLSDRPSGRRIEAAQLRANWQGVTAAGLLFAGDLFFWHLAILNTTLANATLLATMTPIVVVAGAWVLWREKSETRVLAGVVLGTLGALMLVGASVRFAAHQVRGDIFGLITACFFGCYMLVMTLLRRRLPVAATMFYSTLVSTIALFLVAIAFEDKFFPGSLYGLEVLVALALVSQFGGQGLLAYALGYLPPVFSSLVLFLEAVTAALFGWLLFAEQLGVLQLAGGLLIFAGIYSARPGRRRTVS